VREDLISKSGSSQSPAARARASGPVQFDFMSPEGGQSALFNYFRHDRDDTWHELTFEKPLRATKTYVHHDERWQMKFELRPWTKPAIVPEVGSFQVNVQPGGAEVFRNGKSYGTVKTGGAFVRIPVGEYKVEARWPDGRSRSHVVQIERGRRPQFLLNADVATV
jgi:hypothetical protein